jgi:hypothetical protein
MLTGLHLILLSPVQALAVDRMLSHSEIQGSLIWMTPQSFPVINPLP